MSVARRMCVFAPRPATQCEYVVSSKPGRLQETSVTVHWREIGQRASPRRWSGMVWTVVLMVILSSVGTAIVGVKLFQVTDRQVLFNNQ
jgi:hypothetical protein